MVRFKTRAGLALETIGKPIARAPVALHIARYEAVLQDAASRRKK